ncbi:MAG: electron transfer flavoprotein subunit beta/FixA family protein [Elusimicrobiota bacterium]|jgi:electron transfer flavoprotein beta subunit|nr:electron transfer flavoprotein subunit beta/FixA family protein [Elusimicrobiota bacterium]
MNIVVCIKQVPKSDNIQLDEQTGKIKRDGVEAVLNHCDEYAIEEAVRLKEKLPAKVIAVTMGPPSAQSILREAISRGADEGFLLSDKAFGGADVLATAYTLSQGIKTICSANIIICGKESSDGETSQVAPALAHFLNVACVPFVNKIDSIDSSAIKLERVFENGYAVIESTLPVLISVTKDINIPRIASLKGKMNAKKAEIKTLDISAINADENRTGLTGSPTRVANMFSAGNAHPVSCEKLTGDAKSMAKSLVEKLSAAGII